MNIPILGSENPFSKFFRFGRLVDDNIKNEKEKAVNSQGFSQEQIDFGYSSFMNFGYAEGDANYGLSSIAIQFDQYFRLKSQRIFKYREMSNYPDINDGLDMICDEAMVEDSDGDYIKLKLQEEVPEHIEEQLRDMWSYILNDVLSFKETGWELFRRWLIDGELYLELILNDDGDDIIDFKMLPAFTMTPVYDDNSTIAGFVQTPNYLYNVNDSGGVGMSDSAKSSFGDTGGGNFAYDTDGDGVDDSQEIKFDKDQVAYVNYGYTGRNKLDVRGFLESSIRIYNQLKYLEDAVVVYRIVRAPERRIWNIGVGRMPKGKAEEYIQGLIQRYRKNVYYDPSTGAMDASKNFQAMTEDYWFAKDENGYGTDVTSLPGGCFAMDTKVSLLDGRELSIRDIEKEMSEGKELWTYSCHPSNGEVVPGLISWAGVTHKSAKVMKLTLDNGEEIVCTPDHKFCEYSKGFIRADEITLKTELIAYVKTDSKIDDNRDWCNIIQVLSIEYLEDEIEVGTLTIDKDEIHHDYHTFALSVGVFTKNSNLGEMEDVYYFLKKLHQNMKIPKNRWGSTGGDASDIFVSGKSNEITREEIKFSRFVNRLQKQFGAFIIDTYLTQLRLREFDDQYIDETLYRLQFTQSNLWKQYKELELLEARFGILGAIETYIYKPEENENAPFSMEFVLKNWFLMSDDEYKENKELLDKEKEAARLARQDVGFGAEDGAEGFGGEAGAEGGFGGEMGGTEGGFGGDMGGGEAGGFGFGAGGEAEAGGEFGAEPGGATGEFDTEENM